MIQAVKGKSVNEIFYQLLDLSRHWVKNVPRRGLVTVDSPGPVIVELTNPRARVISITGRGASLPAQAAETLWVLGGRGDLAYLTHYLPRAPQFSDDGGFSWRAAYGPRLRAYGGDNDQLAAVVGELRDNPDSRRAVISLLIPGLDHQHFRAKDFPCNQSLSFMVRNGNLDLVTFVRSQDLIWGFCTNLFEFTVLQELVSILTGLPLGSFFNVANSLHYYTEFEPRMERMRAEPLNDYYADLEASVSKTEKIGLDVFDVCMKMFFRIEEKIRSGSAVNDVWPQAASTVLMRTPSIISDLMSIIIIYNMVKYDQLDLASMAVPLIELLDLRAGMEHWLARQKKKGEGW